MSILTFLSCSVSSTVDKNFVATANSASSGHGLNDQINDINITFILF